MQSGERKNFASDLNLAKEELQEKLNNKFQEIENKEINSKLKNNLDLNTVNQLKSELFGKNGKISSEFKKMSSIPALDRKILAEIAYDNPQAFKTIVKKAQSALN